MSSNSDEERQEQKKLEDVTRPRLNHDSAEKLGTDSDVDGMRKAWALLQQELIALEQGTTPGASGEGFAGRLKAKLALENSSEVSGIQESEDLQAWMDSVLGEKESEVKVALSGGDQSFEKRRERFGLVSVLLVAATALGVMFVFRISREERTHLNNEVPAVVRVNPEAFEKVPKSVSPKEVVIPSNVAVANGVKEKLVVPSVRQALAANASKTGWIDPLDARITKVSAKLTKKPAALAGVMDHSLQRLDRRMAKLASQMAQEKL